jgi:hypothetical protein
MRHVSAAVIKDQVSGLAAVRVLPVAGIAPGMGIGVGESLSALASAQQRALRGGAQMLVEPQEQVSAPAVQVGPDRRLVCIAK